MPRAFLGVWGIATLLLVAAVGLMAFDILKEGRSPLTLPSLDGQRTSRQSTSDPNLNATTGEVLLYFAEPMSIALAPESRRIVLTPHTDVNCRNALEALIDGPRELFAPVLSPQTAIRGMYLLDNGELVVDFSREIETGHIKSAAAEILMMRSVVASLTQPALRGADSKIVRTIRFLFKGSPPGDSFPAHIDLTAPVALDSTWIPQGQDGRDHV